MKVFKQKAEQINKHTIMESNNLKFSDDPSVTLTIRLIMQGKVSSKISCWLKRFICRRKISSLCTFLFIIQQTTFFYDHSSRNREKNFPRSGKLRLEMQWTFFICTFWCDQKPWKGGWDSILKNAVGKIFH